MSVWIEESTLIRQGRSDCSGGPWCPCHCEHYFVETPDGYIIAGPFASEYEADVARLVFTARRIAALSRDEGSR